MRVLALDIGGTKISAAMILDGKIYDPYVMQTPSDALLGDKENVADKLTAGFATLLSNYDNFDAVGVCSTGIINKGVLTALNPKNLGGLNEYPLYEVLSKLCQKPVAILNDVQAAAIGEYQHYDHQAVKNFAFIAVSTGVGGGIILNSQLLYTPIAGHVGHSLADPHGPLCGCGRRGCVEALASGRAIEQLSFACGLNAKPKEVFKLFRQGNQQAVRIIEQSATAIANLIADLKITMDIDTIALGGSVGLADGYIELVRSLVEQMPKVYHARIKRAQTGADAGLLGAYCFALAQCR